MTRFHFCRSTGIAAWFIRTFTMSYWNHVAVEVDGIIWQATGGKGVHRISYKDMAKHYHTIESVAVVVPDPVAGKAWLIEQEGKLYDWGAVLGMFFQAKWQSANRWFCSEKCAGYLKASKWELRLPLYRVTPRDLWLALPTTHTSTVE